MPLLTSLTAFLAVRTLEGPWCGRRMYELVDDAESAVI